MKITIELLDYQGNGLDVIWEKEPDILLTFMDSNRNKNERVK